MIKQIRWSACVGLHLGREYKAYGFNKLRAVFVEAAIINPKTGNMRLYSPLVLNDDDPIAAAPVVVPTLSPDDVVGLWFGGNGGSTNLVNAPGTNSTVQGGLLLLLVLLVALLPSMPACQH